MRGVERILFLHDYKSSALNPTAPRAGRRPVHALAFPANRHTLAQNYRMNTPNDDSNRIVFLPGERLYLRPVDPADARLCQRWINDAATRSTLASHMPINEIGEKRYVEAAADTNKSVHLMIVLNDGDRPIGITSLREIRWKDRSADFGIMIGEADCRGQGYGTEATELLLKFAFETLNLHRVQLGVLEVNDAGVRAYEKAGFVREGVQREHFFLDGRYVGHIMYAILDREYFSRKKT